MRSGPACCMSRQECMRGCIDLPAPGHPGLMNYTVRQQDGQLHFDTAEEAEYPWGWCVTYAEALAAELRDITPSPVGNAPVSLEGLIYTQVGATKGLQNEQLVSKVTSRVAALAKDMTQGNESSRPL